MQCKGVVKTGGIRPGRREVMGGKYRDRPARRSGYQAAVVVFGGGAAWEGAAVHPREYSQASECVCVCVSMCIYIYVYIHVCLCEREREET